jgi:predicted DNA-binding transcriptional regulator AlpA
MTSGKTVKTRSQRPPATVSSSPAHLLTAVQVMEMLCIGRVKLHYMMVRDGLPYIKLGEGRAAAVRFSLPSVEQWLAEKTVNAQSEPMR